MAEYRWVDRAMGFRRSLIMSPAGLPLFPGHIAYAFQALQGPSPSPMELTRRIWLLYRGRKEGEMWKDAIKAACEIRHKIILPQPLQLLLELDSLPRNEWEKITYLWSTSSDPLSAISPGIRFNPQGFAGLDNHDIDTADLIRMWTGGSLKLISHACGQRKERSDVKNAFHIALTSPNIWSPAALMQQGWVPSSNLKRLRYTGKLEPALVATWLHDEVGLTSHDVSSQFKPFSLRAFHTDAQSNPRKQYTDLVLPEIYPGSTNDSLPEFGVGLMWTPAHGPSGPLIWAQDTTTSVGVADATNTPMEV